MPYRTFVLPSAVAGAAANAAYALATASVEQAIVWRFMTGLTLAGIYPLGMKLVVRWTPGAAGYALGWLVGTLTAGTATPHLVPGLGSHWPSQAAVLASSAFALAAGVLVATLGDGPHLPRGGRLRVGTASVAFRVPAFRAAALAYFGHMWELYAFWTIVPLLVAEAWPTWSAAARALAGRKSVDKVPRNRTNFLRYINRKKMDNGIRPSIIHLPLTISYNLSRTQNPNIEL